MTAYRVKAGALANLALIGEEYGAAECTGKLLKDTRFVGAGDDAGAATRANRRVGQAAGFDVYKSNNLPAGPGAGAGTYQIAGSRYATTLAEQVRSVEAYRVEKKFADGVKGLHVYGALATRPTALVAADIIIS